MEVIEAELKTIQENVSKVQTVVSSMNTTDIPVREHHHNQQVTLHIVTTEESNGAARRS